MPTLSVNPRAKFDYEILDTYEAGIVLFGHEVKSIKAGRANIKGSHVAIKDNEAVLINANIPPYQPKNTPSDYQSDRTRKLLLNKEEIKELTGKTKQKGLTLTPIRVYTKKGRIKIEIGLGKGKKKFDKRESIKKKEVKRKINRIMKYRG
ncbi:SsrA-binding protein SmpB [Patescibacteria group bacterium]